MSIYDNAGVALIPSGTKASKLYSVLPANGDGDFNATRGSTATRVNKDGFIESVATNVPRLDYPLIDGVVQDCPALLLEPSRTNLITYSEDFTQWTNTGSETTDTADAAISPDGSLNATKLQEANSSFGYHRLSKSITASAATNYALSIFAKKGTQKYVQLLLLNTGDSFTASKVFDLENGTLGETITNGTATLTDAKIEDFGNGWYRCTIIAQLSTAPNTFRINLANAATGNTTSLGMVQYTGNSSGNIFIWGAQLEQANYATSYIPTTSSTVTRSADVCNGAGTSAEFNDSEGVLFLETAILANDGTFKFVSLSDGTLNNTVWIYYRSDTNQINFRVLSGGSSSFDEIYTINDSTLISKLCLKYKENDFSAWVNGFEVLTDTSGSTFSSGTLTTLEFNRQDDAYFFYGKTKQLMTFKTALTDSELETLTSWDSFNAMAKGQLYTIE